MVLKLSNHHLKVICQHGESTYPNECCGLLLGEVVNSSKTVVEVRATDNVWNAEAAQLFSGVEGTRENQLSNYTISPQTMLEVQKEVRDRTLQIIGVYHSHPNHPAIASECDGRAMGVHRYEPARPPLSQAMAKLGADGRRPLSGRVSDVRAPGA